MGEDIVMVWSILLGIPAFCGALLLVLLGGGFLRALLDRYEERPHELARQSEEEFAAIRQRLEELEGQGTEVRQLTERVGFLERLLEGGKGGSLPVLVLVLVSGMSAGVGAAHAQGMPYAAPDSTIAAAAGMAVRNADACAAVWPGYWHRGKPFGFARHADSTVFIYVPAEAPPAPYDAVRGRWLPPELRGALHARRGYPDGFGGVDIWFRVEGATLAVTPAYHPSAEIVLETLYHEGFHAHQLEHFTNVPGARPGFGSNLAPVRLEGSPEAYEELAEAERQALAAALVAPSRDSVRSVLRRYLDLRARRAALAPDAQAVERWEEQTEGTADYVGKLCAAYAIGAGRERARARVRQGLAERQRALVGGRPSKWRAYAVGAALGLLLDDLAGDGWRKAVGAGTALDAYLRGVLEGR